MCKEWRAKSSIEDKDEDDDQDEVDTRTDIWFCLKPPPPLFFILKKLDFPILEPDQAYITSSGRHEEAKEDNMKEKSVIRFLKTFELETWFLRTSNKDRAIPEQPELGQDRNESAVVRTICRNYKIWRIAKFCKDNKASGFQMDKNDRPQR